MKLIPKTHFDFIGARYKFFALSGLIVGTSLLSLATRGINYGIDFTGGTMLQIAFEKPMALAELRAAAQRAGLQEASLQSFSGTNAFSMRLKAESVLSAETMEDDLSRLQEAVGQNKFRVDRKEYVGPSVGKHLFRQALWAIVLSLLGIVVYIAFRFENPIWGVAGVVALGHDVLATYGLFSITGSEVDLVIIAAILTIAGYSINDTIVIFDRMRENLRLKRGVGLETIINDSVNETLSRTIITNATVLAVVLILFLFGGKVIHNFAMAMVFGAVVGTYSTIAIATPFVYEWNLRFSGKVRPSVTPPSPARSLGKKIGGP
jgi:preprotein translocase subunit SecF